MAVTSQMYASGVSSTLLLYGCRHELCIYSYVLLILG